MIAQRRDANEAEIVAAWNKLGCPSIPMDRSAGFDRLMFSWKVGEPSIVEIKEPGKENDLTPHERQVQAICKRAGIPNNIITTVGQAMILAGFGLP